MGHLSGGCADVGPGTAVWSTSVRSPDIRPLARERDGDGDRDRDRDGDGTGTGSVAGEGVGGEGAGLLQGGGEVGDQAWRA